MSSHCLEEGIDGCGVWQAFWRVALPLTAPGPAAAAVMCFIFSWNDFFYGLILTRTNAITAPVAMVNFLQYEAGSGPRSPRAARW